MVSIYDYHHKKLSHLIFEGNMLRKLWLRRWWSVIKSIRKEKLSLETFITLEVNEVLRYTV